MATTVLYHTCVLQDVTSVMFVKLIGHDVVDDEFVADPKSTKLLSSKVVFSIWRDPVEYTAPPIPVGDPVTAE